MGKQKEKNIEIDKSHEDFISKLSANYITTVLDSMSNQFQGNIDRIVGSPIQDSKQNAPRDTILLGKERKVGRGREVGSMQSDLKENEQEKREIKETKEKETDEQAKERVQLLPVLYYGEERKRDVEKEKLKISGNWNSTIRKKLHVIFF